MLQLLKLRQQWERVCEAERVSQARNERLLRELELLDTKTSALALQADRLRLLKDQYKAYVWHVWPILLEARQNLQIHPRSSTPIEDKPGGAYHKEQRVHRNYDAGTNNAVLEGAVQQIAPKLESPCLLPKSNQVKLPNNTSPRLSISPIKDCNNPHLSGATRMKSGKRFQDSWPVEPTSTVRFLMQKPVQRRNTSPDLSQQIPSEFLHKPNTVDKQYMHSPSNNITQSRKASLGILQPNSPGVMQDIHPFVVAGQKHSLQYHGDRDDNRKQQANEKFDGCVTDEGNFTWGSAVLQPAFMSDVPGSDVPIREASIPPGYRVVMLPPKPDDNMLMRAERLLPQPEPNNEYDLNTKARFIPFNTITAATTHSDNTNTFSKEQRVTRDCQIDEMQNVTIPDCDRSAKTATTYSHHEPSFVARETSKNVDLHAPLPEMKVPSDRNEKNYTNHEEFQRDTKLSQLQMVPLSQVTKSPQDVGKPIETISQTAADGSPLHGKPTVKEGEQVNSEFSNASGTINETETNAITPPVLYVTEKASSKIVRLTTAGSTDKAILPVAAASEGEPAVVEFGDTELQVETKLEVQPSQFDKNNSDSEDSFFDGKEKPAASGVAAYRTLLLKTSQQHSHELENEDSSDEIENELAAAVTDMSPQLDYAKAEVETDVESPPLEDSYKDLGSTSSKLTKNGEGGGEQLKRTKAKEQFKSLSSKAKLSALGFSLDSDSDEVDIGEVEHAESDKDDFSFYD